MPKNPASPAGISPRHHPRHVSTRPTHAGPAYPLADYIVPPSDPLGRSVNMAFTGPPDLRRLASIILTRKCYPFETEADVLRWCVYHGMRTLHERAKDKEITASLNVLESWVRVVSEELEHSAYQSRLDHVFGTIDTMARRGHQTKAVALAEMVWRESDKMPDPYWRKYARETAKKKLDQVRVRWKGKKRDAK